MTIFIANKNSKNSRGCLKLELWATVDMAIEDLKREGRMVNVETVKQLINNHKEWQPKLKRPVFSDDNIKAAIKKSGELFG